MICMHNTGANMPSSPANGPHPSISLSCKRSLASIGISSLLSATAVKQLNNVVIPLL